MKNNYETIQECELFSVGTDLSKQKYGIKQVFKIIQQAKREVFDKMLDPEVIAKYGKTQDERMAINSYIRVFKVLYSSKKY